MLEHEYEECKAHWLACTAVMDHIDKMYEMAVSDRKARIDDLAKKLYPDYNSELLHKYLDNGTEPSDDSEYDEYDESREYYMYARDCIGSYCLSSAELYEKYNDAKKTVYYKRCRIAKKFWEAIQSDPDALRGEPWEDAAKRDYMYYEA